MKKIATILLFFLSFTALAIAAANPHDGHMQGMRQGPGPVVNPVALNDASRAYMGSMNSMHDGMMKGIMDPDPDTAFVKGMLHHHIGAVEMARIQLKYGKDPDMRKLAENIIAAQEKEIDMMNKWLEKKAANK